MNRADLEDEINKEWSGVVAWAKVHTKTGLAVFFGLGVLVTVLVWRLFG